MVKKLALLLVLAPAAVWADGLSLTIGPPVAAQLATPEKKFFATLALRINGCADLSKAHLTAMGEGLVGDERRSVPTPPAATQIAGTYMVSRQWRNEGKWVVAVTVTCASETAAAIVPVRSDNIIREGIQMLTHAPTKAEIDAALKAVNPPQ